MADEKKIEVVKLDAPVDVMPVEVKAEVIPTPKPKPVPAPKSPRPRNTLSVLQARVSVVEVGASLAHKL